MADFGYDIADFTEVDSVFGSLADLDRLIEALHSQQIRLILDFIPNHTSDQHPWFIESRSSRKDLKRDWYVWVDPALDGRPPNNWLSRFGGSAWEWDSTKSSQTLTGEIQKCARPWPTCCDSGCAEGSTGSV
jgi:alpha-glucosidase